METERKERSQKMICYKARNKSDELVLEGGKENIKCLPDSLFWLKLLSKQMCIYLSTSSLSTSTNRHYESPENK